MSNLNDYELSLWINDYNETTRQFIERKVAVIGSSEMKSQYSAVDPKLVRNVNGTNTLTFDLYYSFTDNVSGEKVNNPFTDYILNESKIKLRQGDKWYDFLVRNIQKDSSKNSYSYTASDQHIIELSKNGFDVTLNTELMNNSGTAVELAQTILEGSNWYATSEAISQRLKESLVEFEITQSLSCYQIIDDTTGNGITIQSATIPAEAKIYGFYSCNKDQSYRYSFIYVANGAYEVDDERIVINANCQYYFDNASYGIIDQYGLYPLKINDVSYTINGISSTYRGNKYVFSQKQKYDAILDRYVDLYKDSSNNNKITYCYSDTEYIAPNLLGNYITNSSDYKSTAGWKAGYISNTSYSSTYKASIEVKAEATISGQTHNLINDLNLGTYDGSNKYYPHLAITFPITNDSAILPTICNTSFYDVRSSLTTEDFSNGQQMVLLYKCPSTEFNVQVGELEYDETNACYIPNSSKIYLTFNSNNPTPLTSTNPEEAAAMAGYYYQIATISNAEFNNVSLRNSNIKTFITPKDTAVITTVSFEDVMIFKYITDTSGDIITPLNQDTAVQVNEVFHYYYDQASTVKEADEYKYVHEGDKLSITRMVPYYTTHADQIRDIEVKESNYFNSIQTICETFECWANFQINHNDEGKIAPYYYQLTDIDIERGPVKGYQYSTDKSTQSELTSFNPNTTYYLYVDSGRLLKFTNYVGSKNYVGIHYGTNLSKIVRKVSSDKFVSKLCVKQNSNQYAQNGFCTIARAASNETGDVNLYRFDYYVNQNLLNAAVVQDILYYIGNTDTTLNIPVADGSDIFDEDLWGYTCPSGHTIQWNCQGYYPRLRKINNKLDEYYDKITEQSSAYTQARADLTICVAAIESATTKCEDLQYQFSSNYGFEYNQATTEERQHILTGDTEAKNMIVQIAECITTIDAQTKAKTVLTTAVESYKNTYDTLMAKYDLFGEYRNQLNKAFYAMFSQYLQEGSWVDEDYIDDEKYYIDAQSVLYNSSLPSVEYTINIIDLRNVEGFENVILNIADQTYVEDPEFFGYAADGNLYREEVVITEMTSNLDSPEKDSVKVQNYKNQFEDLFHAVNATVQSVKYTTGAYQKAAALAEADTAHKISYLTDALTSASNILTNMGEQSVVWDSSGITITDMAAQNNQLRIISGGILIRTTDDSGNATWKTALTAEGLSADSITSGVLNTQSISIMHGSQAYFRWDALGLTAYDYSDTTGGYLNGLNRKKGVRFDRFGIYGFDVTDYAAGSTSDKDWINWYPTKVGTETDDPACPGPIYPVSSFGLTRERFWFKGATSGVNTLINGDGIKITKGSDQLFYVDSNGNLQIKGIINASGSHIGGWITTDTMLYYGTVGAAGGVVLAPQGYPTAIGGIENVVFAAGANFKVTTDGTLYATNAQLSGSLDVSGHIYAGYIASSGTYNFSVDQYGNMTAISGTIASFVINSNGLYYNGSDTTEGVGLWNSVVHNGIVIHAGGDSSHISDAPFKVMKDGTFYATNANISGDSTFSGSLNAASGTFTGTLNAGIVNGGTLTGNLNAGTTGTITGGTISGATISGGILTSSYEERQVRIADGWIYAGTDPSQNGHISFTGASNPGVIIFGGTSANGFIQLTSGTANIGLTIRSNTDATGSTGKIEINTPTLTITGNSASGTGQTGSIKIGEKTLKFLNGFLIGGI